MELTIIEKLVLAELCNKAFGEQITKGIETKEISQLWDESYDVVSELKHINYRHDGLETMEKLKLEAVKTLFKKLQSETK